MTDASGKPKRSLLLPLIAKSDADAKPLPQVLRSPRSRGGDGEAMALLPGVKVLACHELAGPRRGAGAPQAQAVVRDNQLLALEAADGSTVFIRSDRLLEDIERLCPQAVTKDGQIDFSLFRERDSLSRGAVTDWIWKRVSVLSLDRDAILDKALDLLKEKAGDWLGDKANEFLAALGQDAIENASSLGARALMEAIESQLAGTPGLYQWSGGPLTNADLCRVDDPRFKDWERDAGLLFIHGTGSHTRGGFGDLPASVDWPDLKRKFGGRIFGFEHRTFSESPIDNALALAGVLPKNARICLVTHSRGGLVGDLLCLGSFDDQSARLIDNFRRVPRPDEVEQEAKNPALAILRERVAAEERAKLKKLVDLLATKALRIERYVRVASPAAGTHLLSDNLDVFLSGLLTLTRKLGSGIAGFVAGAVATPFAGQVAAKAVEQTLGLLSRVVLEIADKRLQAQVVPGIEAMLPDSPTGTFLARAPRTMGIRMAVMAGDIEESGGWKRIGVMFTDWMLFDNADNDLVVDTASMYRGLAGKGAHALFDQGAGVNHFSYFRNPRTRFALREWLLEEDLDRLRDWSDLAPQPPAADVSRGGGEPPKDNSRPVVIYLPGIMGSSLEVARRQPDVAGSSEAVWLDLIDLAAGGLKKIARDAKDVAPADLLGLAYGDLARHLERSHRVIRFPYDWRLDMAATADTLAKVIEDALQTHPGQPVRLLAHSMGGLVVRTMIARNTKLWERLVQRVGSRLLMLGTPIHGSHLIVETLLGKSDTSRLLARVDLAHGMQAVLDIVAKFPGVLQLLPRPDFIDTAGPAENNYYAPDTWNDLAKKNNDFWFGKQLGGRPEATDLDTARTFWDALGNSADEALRIGATDRVAYVYGQAENTPCGIAVADSGIEMQGTPDGDGSVTWTSGRLEWLPEERCWTMPVDHMGLVNTSDYFDAITELLTSGNTSRLGRLPVSRGAATPEVRPYQPAPMPGFPSEAELVTRLVGGHSRIRRPRISRPALSVGVKAMDLRFVQQPILCGHYVGDPISGPEAIIDRFLVDYALSRRQNLGVHAAEIGSASVVLMPCTPAEVLRKTRRGAIIVGLGEMGELSSQDITETVRAGVLRHLLHVDDQTLPEDTGGAASATGELKLASLLIGFNSTANISIEESVRAITLGVLEANQQFPLGLRPTGNPNAHRAIPRIQRLEFIELYQDAAITAGYAAGKLPVLLARELKRLDACISPDNEISQGTGARPRLSLLPAGDYWPRLMVTDADSSGTEYPAEAYQIRTINPIPAQTIRQILAANGCTGAPGTTIATGQTAPPAPTRFAERIKYIHLGQRARAEMTVLQRQPELLEKLVAEVAKSPSYTPGNWLGNTLFHLLVPLEFKATAREVNNLILAVDSATANIPWEMLEMDEEPLVASTRVIRQLVSLRFREIPRNCRNLSALLIGNPSTEGYFSHFGEPGKALPADGDHLPSLTGAAREVAAVRNILERNRYQVTNPPAGARSLDVFNALFACHYRILVISSHGIFQVQARDGSWRSGAVLSDGNVLSAAEVGLMEVVPEIVFLNCCHLGQMDGPAAGDGSSRLAYSLAREFIEMGVRCVVAAGWEVHDEAGRSFAECFFEQMVERKATFGDSIFEARKQIYDQYPGINTWGAYQAYGDPDFRLEIVLDGNGGFPPLMTVDQLLDWLAGRKLDASKKLDGNDQSDAERFAALEQKLARRLSDIPASWIERPDVQQAVGLLYGEYGEDGFAGARAALARAIAGEALQGRVGIASIEQLANFEVRHAEKMGKFAEKRKEAIALAEQAINRLALLLLITTVPSDVGIRPNTERQSLLGSAHKRHAALLLADGKAWEDVARALVLARDAYAAGEGDPTAPGFNPYGMLNRLTLDATLGPLPPDRQDLIQRCQAAAHKRFASSYDFWDGVMAADAELIHALSLPPGLLNVEKLERAYRDSLARLSPSPREMDSVVSQLQLLAAFIRGRGQADAPHGNDVKRAKKIEKLADRLVSVARR